MVHPEVRVHRKKPPFFGFPRPISALCFGMYVLTLNSFSVRGLLHGCQLDFNARAFTATVGRVEPGESAKVCVNFHRASLPQHGTQIQNYALGPALAAPLVPMAMFDWPRRQPWIWQIWVRPTQGILHGRAR